MAPRARQKKEDSLTSTLISALKFISVAQKSEGLPYETHCQLSNNCAIASNGALSAGHKIDEDIKANPHTIKLLNALTKCGQNLAITQLDADKLSIKSEKYKAFIPCIANEYLNIITPDAPIANINDEIKKGFEQISCIVADNSDYVVTASICLQANSMLSTNRYVLLEYWHGIDLPPNIVIPKASALAIAKCAKSLVKFGFSSSSATFWFDDESWIKTQLYNEQWPNVSRILDVPTIPKELPVTFYKALDAVIPFAEENTIYFLDGKLSSHPIDSTGATYEIEGLPPYRNFNYKYLKLIEPFMQKVDFETERDKAYFFGDKVRGALMGKRG